MQFFNTSLRQNDVSFFVGRKSAALFLALLTVFSSAVFAASSMAAPFSLGGRAFTLAGNGTDGFSGDGGLAPAAHLSGPSDALTLADGSVLIADRDNNRVRRVNASGLISTFAGNGTAASTGDGGPATAASIDEPRALAEMSDGSVLVVENERVRRIAPDGLISTFAGNGGGAPFIEGVPADKAPLSATNDVDVMPDGSVLIASWGYCAIRIVKPDSKIYNFAGRPNPATGRCDYSGDGGPAKMAEIGRPNSVAVAPDGSVYLVDRYTQRVRRIDPSGKIDLFAGQSTEGFSGDGGPAKNAQFSYPIGVGVAPDGSVFVADTANRRIRKIDAKTNIISTYAGGGPWITPQTEGMLARDAHLNLPSAVNINSNGTLLVTDYWDNKIRFVTPTIKIPGGGKP